MPAPIPAGAWVFHLKNEPPVPRQVSENGDLYYAAYRPRNALAVARGTTDAVMFNAVSRQEMLARPGKVSMTIVAETFDLGQKPPLDEALPITVRWASRNRLLDDAKPAAWGDGAITPEDGQRAYVRVWRRVRRDATGDAPAVLVASFYDLGGSEFTIPVAVFADTLTNPEWTSGNVVSDIQYAGAFVFEVGAQRLESGTHLGTITNPLNGRCLPATLWPRSPRRRLCC